MIFDPYPSGELLKKWAKLGSGWANLGYKNHLSQCSVFCSFQCTTIPWRDVTEIRLLNADPRKGRGSAIQTSMPMINLQGPLLQGTKSPGSRFKCIVHS